MIPIRYGDMYMVDGARIRFVPTLQQKTGPNPSYVAAMNDLFRKRDAVYGGGPWYTCTFVCRDLTR